MNRMERMRENVLLLPSREAFHVCILVAAVFIFVEGWMKMKWFAGMPHCYLTLNVNASPSSVCMVDHWTLIHAENGVMFVLLQNYIYGAVTSKQQVDCRYVYIAILAGLWELLENTNLLILKFRQSATERSYSGDSMANSIMDIVADLAGAWYAMYLCCHCRDDAKNNKRLLVVLIACEALSFVFSRQSCLTAAYRLIVPA